MRAINNLQDVQIVLKDLLDWKDTQTSKAKDQRGLQIKNAGDATDPTDLVTLRQLRPQSVDTKPQTIIPQGTGGGAAVGQKYWRTLLLNDLTKRPSVSNFITIQGSGTGTRIAYTTKVALTGDFSIDFIKSASKTNTTETLFKTIHIPIGATAPFVEYEVAIDTVPFVDGQVMKANITIGNGQKDPNYFLAFTVEWVKT